MKMHPKIIIVIITFISLFFVFYFLNFKKSGEDLLEYEVRNEASQAEESINVINSLWKKTLHEMLQDPLWKERDAYDAGHFLMIPMHYAFKSEDMKKINEFKNFFRRFLLEESQLEFSNLGTLNKLHFLYLASQYLTLSNNPQPELITLVLNNLEEIWSTPAWQWKVCNSPDFNNMEERIRWKLNNKDVPISYCRAIIDEELFIFAITADLKTILLDESPGFVDYWVEKMVISTRGLDRPS